MKIRLVVSFFFLLILSCETPQAPSFVADLNVPLANKTFDVFDIKKELENGEDSVRLEIVGDSVLFTVAHDETITIGDHLDADPVRDSAEGRVENDLSLSDSIQSFFSLGRIAPTSVTNLHGTTTTVPGFNIPPSVQSVSFDNFEQVTIVGGFLETIVVNETGLEFDSLRVRVLDPTSSSVVDSVILSNLSASGGQFTHTKFFIGTRTVYSPLQIEVSGYSSGSDVPILVDSSEAVRVKLQFEVDASSITGLFPSQTIVRTDSVKSSTSSVIDSGYIEKGSITVDFQLDGLEIGATIDFFSSDFDSAGNPLFRRIRVPSDGPVTMNLANWRLVPGPAAIGGQYFQYTYTIVTDSSSSTSTTISNNQGVKAYATLDTMRFSRIRGRLAEEEIDIDETAEELDIEHLDSIQLQRAYFEIITEHKIPFPVSLDLVLTAKKPGQSRTAPVVAEIEPYTGGSEPRRDTVRTTNYAEIASLLSLLPDSIYIDGIGIVGDNVTEGAVNKTDMIKTKILLRAPLAFILPTDTTRNIIRTDPEEIGLSDNDKRRINERLRGVTINGTIRNHFPVPVLVQFVIDSLEDKDKFYDDNRDFRFLFPAEPLLIDKGITNASGVVVSPREVDLNYVLQKEDYERLFDPAIGAIYRGLRVRLLGTGGVVVVSSRDYIDVDASMDFRFFIDEHFGD